MLFYSLFVFCGCVILFVFWTPISLFVLNLEYFEHFVSGGLESVERDMVLDGYLANIDFYTLLIGFNYENLSIIQHLSMNPHNYKVFD